MSIYETDIWRIGIVPHPVTDLLKTGIDKVIWLEEEPAYRFLADPFGLYKEDRLYIFAETYDYRDRHGRIEALVLDDQFKVMERRIVLDKPWHLSYPMLIEDEEDIYMLPESYGSGKLSLYKAVNFPFEWQEVSTFSFPEAAIDPTVLFHDGLWWMFYTPVQKGLSRQATLSVAWSETLMGPWQLHARNPVRISAAGARPGGNAIVTSEGIILPTQDCTLTYGGGLSFLHITTLTKDRFEATITSHLSAANFPLGYVQGIHTLSKAGPYSLIDAKKILNQPLQRLGIDMQYQLNRRLNKRKK